MDPVSIVFIISAVVSLVGTAADAIAKDIKGGQDVTINQLRLLVQTGLSKAYSKNIKLGDKLANQLNSLTIVQRTPALSRAIDETYNRIKQQKSDLEDENIREEAKALKVQNKIDEASDANVFKRKKKIEQAKQEVLNNYETPIQSVETQITGGGRAR